MPTLDLATWDASACSASSKQERTFSWDDLHALPVTDDDDRHPLRHQVVEVRHPMAGSARARRARRGRCAAAATHLLQHAEYGYTTNTPLAEVLADNVLLAWSFGGEPLEPVHGGPLRMVIPRLYFWKSAKWLRGLELLDHDQPGFWEQNGYHNVGDPWLEQRYWGDD